MKVVIAGSRLFDDKERYYHRRLETLIEQFQSTVGEITEVVCGMAKGVDTIGEQWAIANGIRIHRFPPDWKKHGKKAGLLRNEQMGKFADGAIIMWDGKSPGSGHMRNVMRELDKPFLLDIIEPIHYNYEHMPNGTIEQFLGQRPAK